MKIVTVTLCPAIDVHAECDSLLPYRENLLTLKSRDCGGKGINLSRALSNYGIENTALVLLPRNDANFFEDGLKTDRLNYIPCYTDGNIRQNITVHTYEENERKETRFSFKGEAIPEDTLLNTISVIEKITEDNSVLAFCGSLPEGVLPCALFNLFDKLTARGVKIILDSKSFSLEDIKRIKPFLIKPNSEECNKYIGIEPKNAKDAKGAAEKLAKATGANILLSLGEIGAVLHVDGNTYAANAPSISSLSTIGAGDSMLAGFITGLNASLTYPECLRYSVAFGSAKCLKNGTEPPTKSDVDSLITKINIT